MNQNEARQDFAEELAVWLGPVLAEVGLVPMSEDERVQELCDLLAAECKFKPTTPLRKFTGRFIGFPRHGESGGPPGPTEGEIVAHECHGTMHSYPPELCSRCKSSEPVGVMTLPELVTAFNALRAALAKKAP